MKQIKFVDHMEPGKKEIHGGILHASEEGTPLFKWDNVTTKLSDIDTTKLHYVLPPDVLICIDLDIKGEDGKKCFDKNFQEALKFPPTYAELSKSREGIHLYYIYDDSMEHSSW